MHKIARTQISANFTVEDGQQLHALLQRISKDAPTSADIQELNAAFAKWPLIMSDVQGMAANARDTLLAEVTSTSKSTRAAWEADIDSMLYQLGRDTADGLERLLIEQVVTTFFFLTVLEHKYAQIIAANSVSIEVADFHERRMNSVQRRHLRAADMLARYRKLQRYEPDLHLHPAPDLHLHQSPAHGQSRPED